MTVRRAAVISNCQARPIADYLQLRLPEFLFDVLGVHLLDPAKAVDGASKFVERIQQDCDIVFSAKLSENYGPIATSNLAQFLPESTTIFIPNIYFSGLHPDLTYLGGLGQRVQGPLGDYHSKIATIGFLADKSVEDTCLLFNEETYWKLSYFSEFEKSMNELRCREHGVPFGVSEILENHYRVNPCFFTVNHPTSFLLTKYLDGLVDFLGVAGLVERVMPPLDYHLLPNPLSDLSIFPVFPEIAEFHELKYCGSYLFKGPKRDGKELLFDLEGFVQSEYAALKAVAHVKLAAHPVIKKAYSQLLES